MRLQKHWTEGSLPARPGLKPIMNRPSSRKRYRYRVPMSLANGGGPSERPRRGTDGGAALIPGDNVPTLVFWGDFDAFIAVNSAELIDDALAKSKGTHPSRSGSSCLGRPTRTVLVDAHRLSCQRTRENRRRLRSYPPHASAIPRVTMLAIAISRCGRPIRSRRRCEAPGFG
jgi:hypothetical protein